MGVDKYEMWWRNKILGPTRCEGLIHEIENLDSWIDFYVPADTELNNFGVHQQIYDLSMKRFAALYDLIWREMGRVNTEIYHFKISDWQQPIRVAKYTPGLSHDWHVDYTKADRSKLAMSLALNDEYEGGELQILETDVAIGKPEIGAATWFPAYQGHRVTPVTSGVRYALLAWFTGPRFR